jgi:hypothetical protein
MRIAILLGYSGDLPSRSAITDSLKYTIIAIKTEKGHAGSPVRYMKKTTKESQADIVFTSDNDSNIKKVIGRFKNVLICGVVGVGKITSTVHAVKDNTNVYYLGNPVDYEGKMRPGSYEKYLRYIHSLKKDIRIIEDIGGLLAITDPIIVIIDEIYGRSDTEFALIGKVLDKENVQVIQITGCIKNMKDLIDKIDVILELHPDAAFSVDKELARAICRILGKEKKVTRLF